MGQSGEAIDQDTLNSIRERVLEEEKAQLHYNRPPSINNDIEEIIKEEITNVSLENE